MFINIRYVKNNPLISALSILTIPVFSYLSTRTSFAYSTLMALGQMKQDQEKRGINTQKISPLTRLSVLTLCADNIEFIQPLKPYFKSANKFLTTKVFYNLNLFNQISTVTITTSAAINEFIFRGVIQKAILYNLQKKAIKKISPNHTHLADHTVAKVFRITISAILFGLINTEKWPCIQGGTISEVVSGIFYGTIAETPLGLIGSTLTHASDINEYSKATKFINKKV